ncbi:hypothetical protein D3C87_1115060 [compost metagenome]
MPELEKYPSAFCMHGVGHVFPAGDLLVGENARCSHVAFALSRDLGTLSNDQAGACTLTVILDYCGSWNIALASPASRQRRHHHVIFQGEVGDSGGGQKKVEIARCHDVPQYDLGCWIVIVEMIFTPG